MWVFAWVDGFRDEDAVMDYVGPDDVEDLDDDDGIETSAFMTDVEFDPYSYEPNCVEWSLGQVELLRAASYAEQWIEGVDCPSARGFLCVFSPNVIARPEGGRLAFVGRFGYEY